MGMFLFPQSTVVLVVPNHTPPDPCSTLEEGGSLWPIHHVLLASLATTSLMKAMQPALLVQGNWVIQLAQQHVTAAHTVSIYQLQIIEHLLSYIYIIC